MEVCNIYHLCTKSNFILLHTFTFLFLQPIIKKNLLHIKQKLAAVLLLSCLLLAITPKETLHDLFANHTDATYQLVQNSTKTEIAKDSIHCHFDSIFTVNSLFALPATTFMKPDFKSFTKKILIQPVYISLQNATAFLRGPPTKNNLKLS